MHFLQNWLNLSKTLFEWSLEFGSIENHKIYVFPPFPFILLSDDWNYFLEVSSLCPQLTIQANICWELLLKPIWWVENIAISSVHCWAIPIASHTIQLFRHKPASGVFKKFGRVGLGQHNTNATTCFTSICNLFISCIKQLINIVIGFLSKISSWSSGRFFSLLFLSLLFFILWLFNSFLSLIRFSDWELLIDFDSFIFILRRHWLWAFRFLTLSKDLCGFHGTIYFFLTNHIIVSSQRYYHWFEFSHCLIKIVAVIFPFWF